MIDIHSHILPGVDDGAATEQESIAMAKAAVNDGITTIVATPHHKSRGYHNEKDSIIKHVTQLNELLQREEISLHVLPGQEVGIYGELIQDLKKGTIQTINGSNYVIIEFPRESVPTYTEYFFYDLQLTEHVPIIAHPERNHEFLRNQSRVYELVRNGALTQITAGSVLGHFGKKSQALSHQLIEANLTHFIASDAHNTTTRGSCLRDAYQKVGKHHGQETVTMLQANSALVLGNRNVNRLEPMHVRTKRRFFRLY